ncbi:unnamed protein product, partial [marine sediment metagenome]
DMIRIAGMNAAFTNLTSDLQLGQIPSQNVRTNATK